MVSMSNRYGVANMTITVSMGPGIRRDDDGKHGQR
jgi:hypothetical protein